MNTKHVYYHFLLTRCLGQRVLVSKDYPFLRVEPFDGSTVYFHEGLYHCSIDIPYEECDIFLSVLRDMFLEYVPSASAVGTCGNGQGEDFVPVTRERTRDEMLDE